VLKKGAYKRVLLFLLLLFVFSDWGSGEASDSTLPPGPAGRSGERREVDDHDETDLGQSP